MKRGPALAGSALFFLLLAVSPAALAQRVLLLRPPSDDPTLFEAFSRVRAELRLQDFEVSVLEWDGGPVDPITLEDEARKAGERAKGTAPSRTSRSRIASRARSHNGGSRSTPRPTRPRCSRCARSTSCA